MCLKIIALYVHDELTSQEFTDLFFENTELFLYILGEDLYYDIIDTNFNVKEQRISIKTKLTNFLNEKYPLIYNSINDSYIEKIVEKNSEDVLTQILAKRYIRPELAVIDFSGVSSSYEFVLRVRDTLGFRFDCTNWDAINDMLYDTMFPKKIIVKNYSAVKKNLERDFKIFEGVLNKKRTLAESDFIIEYSK